MSSGVAQRLAEVRARIAGAARAAGRAPEAVQLVAVSKFHGEAAIREAHAAGQRVFGENYAQELADKRRALADLPELSFHFIGALQRNKVKLLVPAASVVQTLASPEAGRALSRRASELGVRVAALVQVNVSREPQKAGVLPEALGALLDAVRGLPQLDVTGLMTLPEADAPDEARAAFAELRRLSEAHGLTELSMGMSDDLELAVAEGATIVRVGTAIFGPRPQR